MYHKMIKEICKELNIKFTLLSNNWVIMLEKNNEKRYINGYKFDLNTQATSNIVDDKYAFYDVLKNNNIPIIEHNILYSKYNNRVYAKNYNNYDIAISLFKNNSNHIVIKSNTGTCGNEVYDIKNIDQIIPCLDKLFLNNSSVSICPYYEIENEYRVIILKDNIVLMYKKIKPVVIGDGKSSIRQLLLKFNNNYFKNKLHDDQFDIILKENESYEYCWKFNLSGGATIGIVDTITQKKISKIALKVARAINLKFGSIDIIKTKDNKILVMEANSGVMMVNYMNISENGSEIVKSIYKEAIQEMFK